MGVLRIKLIESSDWCYADMGAWKWLDQENFQWYKIEASIK